MRQFSEGAVGSSKCCTDRGREESWPTQQVSRDPEHLGKTYYKTEFITQFYWYIFFLLCSFSIIFFDIPCFVKSILVFLSFIDVRDNL